MRAVERFAWCVLASVVAGARLLVAQNLDRRQVERIEESLRQEGEAVVALADADRADSTDFSLTWHNDVFKAQTGTFVPFIVTIGAPEQRAPAVLLYVRVAKRVRDEGGGRRRSGTAAEVIAYPFEEIYPLSLSSAHGLPLRFSRGFSIAPGDYDVTVVVRERERETERGRRRMAAVLRKPISVPDFSGPGLMTSSVILADRLTVLPEAPAAANLAERPYVIAGREIEPAVDAIFRRNEELIVLLLVYNPSITADKQFDLEVEYHFFRKSDRGAGTVGGSTEDRPVPSALPGETYFNRTEPQRFTPLVLGPQFDPAAGQPVMAGQGVPLAEFQEGEYRLAIRVTDLVSGKSIDRQVLFTVQS